MICHHGLTSHTLHQNIYTHTHRLLYYKSRGILRSFLILKDKLFTKNSLHQYSHLLCNSSKKKTPQFLRGFITEKVTGLVYLFVNKNYRCNCALVFLKINLSQQHCILKKKNLPLKRLDKYKYKRYSRFASWVDSNNEITANAGRMACKSSAFYLKYNLIKNVNVQFM